MNVLLLMIPVITAQAIEIPQYKRPVGNDQTIPLNLWNVRRYNWDSQENFHKSMYELMSRNKVVAYES